MSAVAERARLDCEVMRRDTSAPESCCGFCSRSIHQCTSIDSAPHMSYEQLTDAEAGGAMPTKLQLIELMDERSLEVLATLPNSAAK